MGGKNPYIAETPVRLPTRKYQITFQPMNLVVQVDPHHLDEPHNGLKGSILHIADENGIDIDHACGGVCACSTCHVIVREGYATCNAPNEAEEDMLENAPGIKPTSRLSCQAVPDGSKDVVVEIPGWNRNLVKEPPH